MIVTTLGAACGVSRPHTTAPPASSLPSPVRCALDRSIASPWPIAEASAAVIEGGELLVASDSGHHGAIYAWNLATKEGHATSLPLDAEASDDIEGAAWTEDALYTLTSSGAVRRFARDGSGAFRASGTYRLGPPPASCEDLREINCGKNWEGLCLRGAAGWAASKKEDRLYPVRVVSGVLAIDASRAPLKLELEKHALSDCTYAQVRLLVTTNLHGGAATYVVDETTGALSSLADAPGTMSNEAIAVDDAGGLWIFQDDNGEASAVLRYACTW